MLYKLFLIFCLYIPFQMALNASQGFDLASGRIFVLILGILWLFKSLAQKKLFIPNKIQTLLIFSFLFLSSLSILWATNFNWSFRKLLFLLSFIPLYFIIPNLSQKKDAWEKVIRFLVYGAGLVSVVGIIQFALQFFIGIDETLRFWQKIITPFLGNSFSQAVFQNPSWLVGTGGKNYLRAIAFFPDPHMFSFYLGMILPFSFSLYLNSSNKNRRTILLLVSIIILIADTLTFSRGGYLGLLAGLAFTFFIFQKSLIQRFSIRKIAATSIIGLIIFIAILFPNPISNRLFSSFDLEEGSNWGRMETWKQSVNIIKKNPWGVGLGNYPLAIKPSADYREPIYSHNLYLDIAAETGILNALIFIFLIIFSVKSFYKNKELNFYSYAGIISLVIFSVHSIFETPLYSIHILPLLLIVISLSVNKNE